MNTVPNDLLIIKELVYDANKFKCSPLIMETESAEYGAHEFKLNDYSIKFRVAKITPTKIGQFVTFWKRVGKGPIQPHDLSDRVDFFVVSTRKDNHFGHFVFPKSILCQQNIMSSNGKGGKRAIRVYPPWDKTTSRQAQKTQQWQLDYFLEIPTSQAIDFERAKMLYLLKSI